MGQNLEQMGEDIRVQGGQGSGSMTELFFDQDSGEFVTKPKGSSVGAGKMNVTGMTEEGFAMV